MRGRSSACVMLNVLGMTTDGNEVGTPVKKEEFMVLQDSLEIKNDA